MVAFVGRSGELAALTAALDAAARREPRIVLVEGVAGSGKTRLVREAVSRRPGLAVRDATGDEHESGVPFGVLDQLFGPLLWPDGRPDAREDPQAVGVRLLRAFGRLPAPTVLLVDDAHWSDESSAQALAFTLRRLTAEAVCVVLLTRPDPPALLLPVLRIAEASGGGLALRLAGLDEFAALELSTGLGRMDLTRWQVQRLVRHTEGNPLHLIELLRELHTDVFPGTGLPAPRSLTSLMRSRMDGCSQAAVRFAAAVVVLGRDVPLLEAAGLAGVPHPLAAAEEAVGAGLVDRSGVAPDYRLGPRNALLAAALVEVLPATLLTTLHRRAAVAARDEVARLRHLVAGAAGTLDVGLAEHVRARTAALVREGTAARVFDITAGAARLVRDQQHRSILLLDAAEQAVAAGQAAAAAALVDEVEDRFVPVRAAFLRGVVALHQGDPVTARTHLESAWCWTDETDASLRWDIAGHMAGLELNAGHGLACAAWAGRSRPAPHMLFPPEGLAAIGLAIAGRTEDALSVLPAPSAERRTGRLAPAQLGAVAARGIVELFRDELDAAAQDLSAVAETARESGLVFAACCVLGNLGEVEHRLGKWDLGLRHAQLAVAAVVDSAVLLHLGHAHALAVPVLARRGQWEAAGTHVRAALEAAQEGGEVIIVAYAATAGAQLAHARGDVHGVLDATEPLLGLDVDGVREPGVLQWQELRAEALIQVGRLDEARLLLERCERLSRERGRCSALGAAAQVRGQLEQVRGRDDLARKAYEASLQHRGRAGMPFELARGQLAYGRALRSWGLVAPAALQLQAAAATLRRLRAAPYLRLAEQELEQAAGTVSSLEHLTPQEVSVAQLVLAGLRNREIADRLFVSVKTVEFHLQHVYAKLGVTSRSQLVRRLSAQTQS